MDNNFLRLNGDKTEVMLIGSRHQISKAGHLSGSVLEVQSRVRNLGDIIDAHLCFDSFIPLFSTSEISQDCVLC